jgi:hypothetical protein
MVLDFLLTPIYDALTRPGDKGVVRRAALNRLESVDNFPPLKVSFILARDGDRRLASDQTPELF